MSTTEQARARVARQLLELSPRLRRLISAESQASDSSGVTTFTQLRVLAALEKGCALSSGLARDMGVTPASASEIVDGLVRRGLVERRTSPSDRRQIPLCITPAGVDRLAAARIRVLASLVQLLEAVPPEQLPHLETGLAALLGEMQERKAASPGGPRAD